MDACFFLYFQGNIGRIERGNAKFAWGYQGVSLSGRQG